MTVTSTTRKTTFTGGTATLTFAFEALAATDIKVTKRLISTGAETALTYTTDYSVVLNSDKTGGTVTVSPTISTLYTLTVYRDTTDKQESDYEDYNQFPADTLETDLDRRTMVSQEKDEEITRAIKFPISYTGSADLPTPVADNLLGWNAAADAIENKIPATYDFISVDTDTALGTSDAKIPSQNAVRGYFNIFNVKTYGAVGDGVTDDTTSIQATFTAAVAASGGIVFFPSGNYIVTDEFTITGSYLGIRIIGTEQWTSKITQTTTNKNVFNLTSVNAWTIEHLQFIGTSDGTGNAFELSEATHGHIEDCQFANWGGNSIYITGSASSTYDVLVKKCHFSDSGTGDDFIESDSQTVSAFTIENCSFASEDETDSRAAIKISGFGLRIIGNTIQTLYDGINIPRGKGINIENNYFELMNHYAIQYGSTGAVSGININGNYFATDDLADGGTDIYQDAYSVYDLNIGGNYYADKSNAAKKLNFAGQVIGGIVILEGTVNTSAHCTFADLSGFIMSTGGLNLPTNVQTLAGAKTIYHYDNFIHILDPNSSDRNITFDTAIQGRSYKIINSGSSGDLIMKSVSDYAIKPSMSATFTHNGSSWIISDVTGRGITAASSGTGTILMGSANPANSAGFIEIQPGKFVPYFTDATP